jgi:hypothetical protein
LQAEEAAAAKRDAEAAATAAAEAETAAAAAAVKVAAEEADAKLAAAAAEKVILEAARVKAEQEADQKARAAEEANIAAEARVAAEADAVAQVEAVAPAEVQSAVVAEPQVDDALARKVRLEEEASAREEKRRAERQGKDVAALESQPDPETRASAEHVDYTKDSWVDEEDGGVMGFGGGAEPADPAPVIQATKPV